MFVRESSVAEGSRQASNTIELTPPPYPSLPTGTAGKEHNLGTFTSSSKGSGSAHGLLYISWSSFGDGEVISSVTASYSSNSPSVMIPVSGET
jgi:hypothetical protein